MFPRSSRRLAGPQEHSMGTTWLLTSEAGDGGGCVCVWGETPYAAALENEAAYNWTRRFLLSREEGGEKEGDAICPANTRGLKTVRVLLIRMSQCVLVSKVMGLILLLLSCPWSITSSLLSIVYSSSFPLCFHLPFLHSHQGRVTLCVCACVTFLSPNFALPSPV